MSKLADSSMPRQQKSLLSGLERRILIWTAARLPQSINSDHLTALGFLAMLLAGLAYYLSGANPAYLHLVNFCLFLNWFGDSLDGTLARYRNCQRPRYGYYVDHILDCFGAVFLLGGLGLSPFLSTEVACGLIIGYLMLAANSFLAVYTMGTFQISYWIFSPTELRLLAMVGNLFLFYKPWVELGDRSYRLFDVGGLVAIVGMALFVTVSAFLTGRHLYRLETRG